jgi:hypothetical protein
VPVARHVGEVRAAACEQGEQRVLCRACADDGSAVGGSYLDAAMPRRDDERARPAGR